MTNKDHREPPRAGPSLSSGSNSPALSPAPQRALDWGAAVGQRCLGHCQGPVAHPPGSGAPSVPHSKSAGKLEQRSPAEFILASRGSMAIVHLFSKSRDTLGRGRSQGATDPN